MNLQQLKYIVALNRFRNFARAAEVETIALNGVNIEVEDGEFIAIMCFQLRCEPNPPADV